MKSSKHSFPYPLHHLLPGVGILPDCRCKRWLWDAARISQHVHQRCVLSSRGEKEHIRSADSSPACWNVTPKRVCVVDCSQPLRIDLTGRHERQENLTTRYELAHFKDATLDVTSGCARGIALAQVECRFRIA